MSYVYNVGYGTCEESDFVQWIHAEQFSEDELSVIVEDCLIAALKKLAHPKSEYLHQRSPSFQDLMESTQFHAAMRKHGFARLRFVAAFSVFGWAEALDKGSWASHTDDGDKRMAGRLLTRFLKLRPNYLKELKIGKRKENRRRK